LALAVGGWQLAVASAVCSPQSQLAVGAALADGFSSRLLGSWQLHLQLAVGSSEVTEIKAFIVIAMK
jgi:hypothetical protein